MDTHPIQEVELDSVQLPTQVGLPVPAVDVTDDDAVLDFAQGVRKTIVTGMLVDGKIPQDTKEVALLASVLNDMSGSAMQKKRLGAQQREADQTAAARMFVAQVMAEAGNTSPFLVPKDKRSVIEHGAPAPLPELPAHLEAEFQIRETEMIQGLNTERSTEFQERMAPIMEEVRRQEAAAAELEEVKRTDDFEDAED